MTVIGVAGGTGTAGKAVLAEAVSRGLAVRSISRRVPEAGDPRRLAGVEYVTADFRSGAGVTEAMAGIDVVVDTLDARTGAALRALPATSMAVLAAAQRAGVSRCVLLSIVNAAECSMPYYQVQAGRARSYEAADLATTVVYATQFHNLVAGLFSAGSRMAMIPSFAGVSFQPIATADLAKVLVDEALNGGATSHHLVTAGGPTIWTMKSLAEQWKATTHRRGVITSMPLPGSFGTFLRAGRNLVPESAVDGVEFRDWLRETAG